MAASWTKTVTVAPVASAAGSADGSVVSVGVADAAATVALAKCNVFDEWRDDD